MRRGSIDIRWPNVIKRCDCNSWFLIDFVDAAKNSQTFPSGDHLSEEEHAPEIFVEGDFHTTAVDIWAVGYLIQESSVEWDDLGERTAFSTQKDPASRPTADEALRDLKALEAAAMCEQEAAGELQIRDKHRRRKLSRMILQYVRVASACFICDATG
ncbi:hypothetical protein V7S43_002007 [Phytophthora oleae]|uniref:Protein kinase domain-containing protein n=1 Tax=Phytophthora oleae TaxID=2107226 RepID=A0ABD3G4G3_9STRA